MFSLLRKITDEASEGKGEGAFSVLLTPISSLLSADGAQSESSTPSQEAMLLSHKDEKSRELRFETSGRSAELGFASQKLPTFF